MQKEQRPVRLEVSLKKGVREQELNTSPSLNFIFILRLFTIQVTIINYFYMYAPRDSPPRGVGRATSNISRIFICVCVFGGQRIDLFSSVSSILHVFLCLGSFFFCFPLPPLRGTLFSSVFFHCIPLFFFLLELFLVFFFVFFVLFIFLNSPLTNLPVIRPSQLVKGAVGCRGAR